MPAQSRLSSAGSREGPGVWLLTLYLAEGQMTSRSTWFGTSSRSAGSWDSTQQGWAQGLLLLHPAQSHQERPVSARSMMGCKAWHCSRPGIAACLAACSPRSPCTLRELLTAHVPRGHSGKFETACMCGSIGTSELLGGCGPPVRHRDSQGHPATPSGSDMERALNFL